VFSSVVRRPSSVVHLLSSTFCRPPSVVHLLSSTFCRPPSVCCLDHLLHRSFHFHPGQPTTIEVRPTFERHTRTRNTQPTRDSQLNSRLTTHDSRLSTHDSRLTTHDSTTHNSTHDSRLTTLRPTTTTQQLIVTHSINQSRNQITLTNKTIKPYMYSSIELTHSLTHSLTSLAPLLACLAPPSLPPSLPPSPTHPHTHTHSWRR